MKKRIKKGFTLVELLIVIGVLAVLAAVSVVGYFGFVKKHKVNNDISLTTQMNTILQAVETGGETFATPHDAITALKERGLDVTKFTPTTDGYSYIYDQEGKRMILVDSTYNVIAPESASINNDNSERYFFFVSNVDEVNTYTDLGYSVYLNNGFDATAILTVKTGIDVGDNENISAINYVSNDKANESLIRVDSINTKLTFNDSNDTCYFYGLLGDLDLQACKDSSFHNYGQIAFAKIGDGRYVLEPESKTHTIYVTDGEKSIVYSEGGTYENVYASSNDAITKFNANTEKCNIKIPTINIKEDTDIDKLKETAKEAMTPESDLVVDSLTLDENHINAVLGGWDLVNIDGDVYLTVDSEVMRAYTRSVSCLSSKQYDKFISKHKDSMLNYFYDSANDGKIYAVVAIDKEIDTSEGSTRSRRLMDVAFFSKDKIIGVDDSVECFSAFEDMIVTSYDEANDTYEVTDHFGESELTTIDLSWFDASKMTTYANMFAADSVLTEIKGIENLKDGKPTSIASMFNGCNSLSKIDLSSLDFSAVTNTKGMISTTKNVEISLNTTLKAFSLRTFTSLGGDAVYDYSSGTITYSNLSTFTINYGGTKAEFETLKANSDEKIVDDLQGTGTFETWWIDGGYEYTMVVYTSDNETLTYNASTYKFESADNN